MEKSVKKQNTSFKMNELIQDIFYIVFGTYLVSFGINFFLLPLKLTTGGVSGIGTILYYLFNIPLGVTTIILNIPLFILSLKKLGLKSSIKTICSTILLSVFLDMFKYQNNQITDLFTSAVFGGIVMGTGLSIVFKAGASTGGSDLLAQVIYKVFPVQSLSQILLLIETVIIGAVVVVFKNINLGLYSIIAMFISSKVIDVIFEGIYYTKVVNIYTTKQEKITKFIIEELDRGATLTKSLGAHTNTPNTTITCILTRPQVAKLKRRIKDLDKDALLYIATTNEVFGNGFKSIWGGEYGN